jgi:folate-binding protein YgfZ
MQFAEAADVIDVRVGADDGFDDEAVASNQVQDASNFIPGVHYQSFARGGIADDGAIALQHPHRDSDVNQSVSRGAQRRASVTHRHEYSIANGGDSRARRLRDALHPAGHLVDYMREVARKMSTQDANAGTATSKINAAPLNTPLAAVHAASGAKMGVWFGCGLPDYFGDAAAEYRSARDTVALIDKNYRAYISFTGPDRVRYLNAILTNNIKDLGAGQGTVSLLLNPQGHILAEIETYAFADRLLCVSYGMIREQLIELLNKYIIMDDVKLVDETPRYGVLAVEGPKAAALVQEVCGADIMKFEELSVRPGTVGSIPCRIVRRSPGGVPGAEFMTEREKLAELWQVLLDAARWHEGGPMGYAALSATRLAQGVPWFGYDFGEKQIPHEAGLQDSHISYTKGCYTGQEIVERVRSRGQVNRQRVPILFSGEVVPEANTLLMMDGKEVGYVTRAARAWDPARILGMGYVRKEVMDAGAELQWVGGTATVTK